MKNDTRLPAFAEAYQKQIDQEAEYGSMQFYVHLMLLVDAEYDSRLNNNIKKRFYTECWGVLKNTLPTFFSL